MVSKRYLAVIAGSVVLVCLTLLSATLILSNGNFYIKNMGSSTLENDKLLNTISVSGDGKVYAKPDMVNMTVSVSELAATSGEALEKANGKIGQALSAILARGVDANDIQTSQLSIYPEYDYRNNETILKGQRATVSLSVKVKQIDDKASKATLIIDDVSKIDNIQISGISFDIENKTALFTEARKLAFDKAKQKASELAGLGEVNLLTPVSISDATYDIAAPQMSRNIAESFDGAAGAPSTNISTGQLEITVNLEVIFGTE